MAVEAALLALTIPLSFEIISRISERYESDALTSQFANERVVKAMPYCLMFNIGLAVTMEFLKGHGEAGSPKWRIMAWAALAGFLTSTGVFFWFLERLKLYIIDRKFVLNAMFGNADESIP